MSGHCGLMEDGRSSQWARCPSGRSPRLLSARPALTVTRRWCDCLEESERDVAGTFSSSPQSSQEGEARNDSRWSDRSPRPRSFFSGRMPSFPLSVKKRKHRLLLLLLLLLLCGFGEVVDTFCSAVSLISAGLSRPAAWFVYGLQSFSPGRK